MLLTDPVHTPKPLSFVERFVMRFINDERDLPFVFLALTQTLIVIPAAVTLFVLPVFHWWYAVPYWLVTLAWFLGPYI